MWELGQWMFGEISFWGQMGTLGPMSIGIGGGWDGKVGVGG